MKKPQKKAKKSGVTLDDLANTMGRGFKEVNEKIDDLDGRISGRMDNLEGRMGSLEGKMDAIRNEIQLMYFDHKKVEKRVEKLEMKSFGSIQS